MSAGHASHRELLRRRNELIEDCQMQRQALAAEAAGLLLPFGHGAGRLRAALGARLKIPLMLGGMALGLLVARPKRILPMLMAGAALWKSASGALPLVRRVATLFNR